MHQLEIKFSSRVLITKIQVLVLLPEAMRENGEKLKVLWLLHGASEDCRTWVEGAGILGLMRQHPDFMVVMPSAQNCDYANQFQYSNGYDFPKFFFEELMPFVHSALPASNEPADNYISGYSMGGAGALLLGLKKPELFSAVYPMGASARRSDFLLPYAAMSGAEFRDYAWENRKEFPTEYGLPSAGITYKEINMIAKYRTVRDYIASDECTTERALELIAGGRLPDIHFICGSEDDCCADVARFIGVVRNEGIGNDHVDCVVLPGIRHNGGAGETLKELMRQLSEQK